MTALRKIESDFGDSPLPIARTAHCIVGGERNQNGLPEPMRPTAHQVFAPRGACLHLLDGSFWICDTGHHRLLGWETLPRGGEPADWVIGQANFNTEGRNAGEAAGPNTLNVPTSIAAFGRGLVVADAWNHRILVWQQTPTQSGQLPDFVLGQSDFSHAEGNRGLEYPSANSLFWPFGVLADGEGLWVADTGNRRILHWHQLSGESGQPADLVLGQDDFQTRDENRGGSPDAGSMRWPHGLALWNDRLCVADAGNNRIMIFADRCPNSAADASVFLGQCDAHSVMHQQGQFTATANTLNMPYSIASNGDWLIAADTANSRLLAWHSSDLQTGANACALAGHSDFSTHGDNGWGQVSANTLSWPYSITIGENQLVVADTGNSRVLVQDLIL